VALAVRAMRVDQAVTASVGNVSSASQHSVSAALSVTSLRNFGNV